MALGWIKQNHKRNKFNYLLPQKWNQLSVSKLILFFWFSVNIPKLDAVSLQLVLLQLVLLQLVLLHHTTADIHRIGRGNAKSRQGKGLK